MLQDWYYCNTAQFKAEDSRLFLAILDTLRREKDSRDPEYDFAVAELRKLDGWMQIYALPYVLDLLASSDLSDASRTKLGAEYFEPFYDQLPPEGLNAFLDLIPRVQSLGRPQPERLRAAAQQSILYRKEQIAANSTPYLDIADFAPEALLIGLLAQMGKADPDAVAKLIALEATGVASEDDRQTECRELLERALKNRLGRFCLLLAIQVALVVKGEWTREALLECLWSPDGNAPSVEPDLLLSTARIWFLGGEEPRKPVELAKEMVFLGEFRQIRSRWKDTSKRDAVRRALTNIGFGSFSGADPATINRASVVLWHHALWSVLVEHHPEEAVSILAPLWLPRVFAYPEETVSICIPETEDDAGLRQAKFDYMAFAGLQTCAENRPKISISKGKSLQFTRGRQWTLFSPWLHMAQRGGLASTRMVPQLRGPNDCRDVFNPGSMLRLRAALDASLALLRRLGGEEPQNETLEAHAGLVMHAYHAFEPFHKSFIELITNAEYAGFPDSLKVLAADGARAAKLVGIGRVPSVEPNLFITAAENMQHNESPILEKTASMNRYIRIDAHYLFCQVMPWVLIRWIHEAFENASWKQNGRRRWAGEVERVGNVKLKDFESKLLRELMLRFLSLDPESGRLRQTSWSSGIPDWRAFAEKNGQWARHRQILLSNSLAASEWIRDDLPNLTTLPPAKRIAVSLERVAAVDANPDCGEERARQWRADLKDALTAATRQDVDRFIRLRLLEVARLESVIGDGDLGRAIVAVVVEFGCVHDLQELFRFLFQVGRKGCIVGEFFHYAVALLLRRCDYQKTQERQGSAVVCDPELVRDQRIRADILDTFLLGGLVADEARGLSPMMATAYLNQLRSHRDNERRRLLRVASAVFSGQLHYKQGRTVVEINASAGARPTHCDVQAAVIDPNREIVILRLLDLVTPEVAYDLFSMSTKQRKHWEQTVSDGPEADGEVCPFYLARFVEARDDHGCMINAGSGACLYYFVPESIKQTLMPGDKVRVKLCKPYKGKRGLTCPRRGAFLVPLAPTSSQEEHISVEYRLHRSHGPDRVKLAWQGSEHIPHLNKTHPDYSFFFDLENRFEPYHIVFERRKGEVDYVPRPLKFKDLLLDGFGDELHTGARILTLTSVRGDAGEGGDMWILVDAPGIEYHISGAHFTENTLNQLEMILDRIKAIGAGDGEGLLIALRPVCAASTVKLDLVYKFEEVMFNGRKPTEMEYPFDFRNLRWKHLFDPINWSLLADDSTASAPSRDVEEEGRGNTISVNPGQGGFAVDISGIRPKGFPDSLEVQIEPSFRWPQGSFEGIPDWSAAAIRGGPLRVTPVKTNLFNFANVLERNTILNRQLALHDGQVLTLEKPIVNQVGRTGCYIYTTKEKLTLSVQVESLTMRPVADKGLAADGFGGRGNNARYARITFFKAFRHSTTPKLDGDSVAKLKDSEGPGIIFKTPHRKCEDKSYDGNHCGVFWKRGEEYEEVEIQIENINIFNGLHPGARLRRSAKGGFIIETLCIKAEALWRGKEVAAFETDTTKLGQASLAGKYVAIAENEPGQLHIRPSDSRKNGGKGLSNPEFFLQLASASPCDAVVTDKGRQMDVPWKYIRHRPYRRALLEGGGKAGAFLCGSAELEAPVGAVAIDDVEYCLEKVTGVPDSGEWFALDRVLHLRERRQRWQSRVVAAVQPIETNSEKLDSWAREYLRAERPPVTGVWMQRRGARTAETAWRFVPESFELRRLFPDGVPILDGEEPFWVDFEGYPKSGRAVLFVDYPTLEGSPVIVRASAREAPPIGLYEFYTELSSPALHNDVLLGEEGKELLLVRRPTQDGQVSEAKEGNTDYIFEFARGWTVAVPLDRLQYQGHDGHRQLLFYGDRVRRIRFTFGEIAPDASQENVATANSLALSIEEIFRGQGHQLFAQASNHRFVHMLELVCHRVRQDGVGEEDGNLDVTVAFVEGFDPERGGSNNTREFMVSVSLEEKSRQRMVRRAEAHFATNDDKEWRTKILGRLDKGLFLSSIGYDIHFEHVRLTFQQAEHADHGSPLCSHGGSVGESLFFTAGSICAQKNRNYYLELFFRDLDPGDVGSDFSQGRLRLMHRQFSIRSSLMEKLHDRDAQCLEKQGLLLWVSRGSQGGPIFNLLASNIPRLPMRGMNALYTLAKNVGGMFFAMVAKNFTPGNDYLCLELEPGVFLDLPKSKMQVGDLPVLQQGAMVILDAVRDEDHSIKAFRVALATFSDIRYLHGRQARPMVFLPKNTLLKPNVNLQAMRPEELLGAYTVAGFPDLKVMMERGAHVYGGAAGEYEDVRAFMSCRHPKTGWVKRPDQDHEEKTCFRFTPDISPTGLWGVLRYDAEKRTIVWRPYAREVPAERQEHGEDELLNWRLTTYGDESIRDVIARMQQEQWRYHDDFTGYWEEVDGELRTRETRLGMVTATTVPIFRMRRQGELRLRSWLSSDPQARSEFLKSLAFPVNDLIHSFERPKNGAPRERWYPVVAAAPDGGVFIEMTPGHIVEVPSSLFVTMHLGRRHSLTHFNWDAMHCGDMVQLSVVFPEDIYGIEQIVLHSWRPGPRKGFGAMAILPKMATDSDAGLVVYGVGVNSVRLPCANPDEAPTVIMLNQNNEISPITDNQWGKHNEGTILVGHDNGGLVVHGLAGWRVYPDPMYAWEMDSLGRELANTTQNGCLCFNMRNLGRLIDALGGAMAFTAVELCECNRIIYVNRSWQHGMDEVPLDKVIRATVRGIASPPDSVIVSFGAGLVVLPAWVVVQGLPRKYTSSVIECITKQGIVVWLSRRMQEMRNDGGEPEQCWRCQIKPQLQNEFSVSVEACIPDTENNVRLGGLLCRGVNDLGLYWMDATQAAWTSLSFREAEQLFLENKTPLEIVRLGARGPVSAVRHQLAHIDFHKASRKNATRVKWLREISHDATECTGFVRLARSKTIARCRVRRDENVQAMSYLRVVVSRREDKGDFHRVLEFVSEMARSSTLALPSTMRNLEGRWDALPEVRGRFLPGAEASQMAGTDPRHDEVESVCGPQLIAGYQMLRGQDNLTAAVRAAGKWARYAKDADEIDLLPSICSILIMLCASKQSQRVTFPFAEEQNATRGTPSQEREMKKFWQAEATALLSNLYARAIRSLHVEGLMDHISESGHMLQDGEALSKRLGTVLALFLTLHPKPSIESALEELARGVVVYGRDDALYHIINYLGAAVGRVMDMDAFVNNLAERESVLEKLLKLARPYCSACGWAPSELLPRTEWALASLVEYIIATSRDVTLLPPLPTIDQGV